MNTLISLQNKAINAAKAADWDLAASLNEEILDLDHNNIGALNRLAVCKLQLGHAGMAKGIFEQVLVLDPANTIAAKQISNLKQNIVKAPAFTNQYFVEEPGKSKVIPLSRLAAKNIIEQLHIGQELELKPKNRYLSTETVDKVYIGSLPEDISLRLTKLIGGGNTYLCQVHSFCNNACSVFIKELTCSAQNQGKLSFIVGKNNHDASGDLSDDYFIENDIPLNLNDTDAEMSSSGPNLDNFDNENED